MRLATRNTQTLLDLAVLSLAYWAGFWLRFDGEIPPAFLRRLLFSWPYVVALELAILSVYSVHRFSWRHVGLKEAGRILSGTVSSALVLLGVRFAAEFVLPQLPLAQYALIPVGVIAGNGILAFLGVVGIRVLRRLGAERESTRLRFSSAKERVPTLLIGAGQAGLQVAREIEKRPDLGLKLVGFLDDDKSKHGTTVNGVRVWGSLESLHRLVARLGVKQVIVTIADLDTKLLRRIFESCEAAQIRAKIVPGLYQLLDTQAPLGRIRDVSIEDLLGREAVQLDTALLGTFLSGKRVVVTGAGGSIGSELCRQVAKFAPQSLILIERSEFALFTIHQELLGEHPTLKLLPRICDVCDVQRLDTLFTDEQPQVVFHAAAHKHVPLMEDNPGEAIKNNVFGTKAVADVANNHQCEAFVLISTDKAVNPTSIMGATKRVAEMYVQAVSALSKTKYVAVRFGNVLGSTGSVVPTFKAQIAAGGPVTVTHPDMVRYFMTIPEASQLVMQAAAMGQGGELFVLDMGDPVKIVDLAYDIIRLSGLVPGVDIEIQFTGTRPGEKLFEELGLKGERIAKTSHHKIYQGQLEPAGLASIEASLRLLSKYAEGSSTAEVRRALGQVVPEMLNGHAAGPHCNGQAESATSGDDAQLSIGALASSPARWRSA